MTHENTRQTRYGVMGVRLRRYGYEITVTRLPLQGYGYGYEVTG